MGNSVTVPLGVMRPILLPMSSVNQRLPSGPEMIWKGRPDTVGTAYSVMVPAVVIFPICLVVLLNPVNQRFPSGPAVRAKGWAKLGTGNSVKVAVPVAALVRTSVAGPEGCL